MALEQLPPRKIVPEENCLPDNYPLGDCSLDDCLPQIIAPPRTIAPEDSLHFPIELR